jgi:hypothetical protein
MTKKNHDMESRVVKKLKDVEENIDQKTINHAGEDRHRGREVENVAFMPDFMVRLDKEGQGQDIQCSCFYAGQFIYCNSFDGEDDKVCVSEDSVMLNFELMPRKWYDQCPVRKFAEKFLEGYHKGRASKE